MSASADIPCQSYILRKEKPTKSLDKVFSPDRVSTAIRCRKATENQCASVSGTSLKNKKAGEFERRKYG